MDNVTSTEAFIAGRNSSSLVHHDDVACPFIPLSRGTFEYLTYILNGVLTPVACVVGFVGNLIGLIIVRKKSKVQKHNFHFYMKTLFANNMAFCLVTLALLLRYVVGKFDVYFANLLERYLGIANLYLTKVFSHFTVAIIIMMSLERLFSVLKPYTFLQFCIFTHPRRVLATSFVIFSIYLLPVTFCCEYVAYMDHKNKTFYQVQPRAEIWTFFHFFAFVHSIGLYLFLPLCVLVINILIPIAYYSYTKRCEITSYNGAKRIQQTKITAVTFSIIILHLLLSLPSLFAMNLSFINNTYSSVGRFEYVFYFFMSIGLFLTQINCVCDCVVYCLFEKEFWLRFRGLYCINVEQKPRDHTDAFTLKEQ